MNISISRRGKMDKYSKKSSSEEKKIMRKGKIQDSVIWSEHGAKYESDSQEEISDVPSAVDQQALGRNAAVNEAQRTEAILDLQQTHGNLYVQRMVDGGATGAVDEDVIQRVKLQKGAGESISPDIRREMESAFGRELDNVKLHTDSEADVLSRKLGAKAFTSGKDIFFKNGAYQPSSSSGKKLIRHELTHTLQQSEVSPSEPTRISQPGEPLESEAERVGEATEPITSTTKSAAVIARVPDDADAIILNLGVGIEEFEKQKLRAYYETDPDLEKWMDDIKNFMRMLGYSF
jgi:hypothetical protein